MFKHLPPIHPFEYSSVSLGQIPTNGISEDWHTLMCHSLYNLLICSVLVYKSLDYFSVQLFHRFFTPLSSKRPEFVIFSISNSSPPFLSHNHSNQAFSQPLYQGCSCPNNQCQPSPHFIKSNRKSHLASYLVIQ